uniref:Uncharacterized protein n=1 Tax=Macrostomum lignano TaxID=282301 RepID=A0A1I8FPV6_9PLAT
MSIHCCLPAKGAASKFRDGAKKGRPERKSRERPTMPSSIPTCPRTPLWCGIRKLVEWITAWLSIRNRWISGAMIMSLMPSATSTTPALRWSSSWRASEPAQDAASSRAAQIQTDLGRGPSAQSKGTNQD